MEMRSKVTHFTCSRGVGRQEWHGPHEICVLQSGIEKFHEVSTLSPVWALFFGFVEEYPESAKLTFLDATAFNRIAMRPSIAGTLTRGKR
jgi:hypothetical protein